MKKYLLHNPNIKKNLVPGHDLKLTKSAIADSSVMLSGATARHSKNSARRQGTYAVFCLEASNEKDDLRFLMGVSTSLRSNRDKCIYPQPAFLIEHGLNEPRLPLKRVTEAVDFDIGRGHEV